METSEPILKGIEMFNDKLNQVKEIIKKVK